MTRSVPFSAESVLAPPSWRFFTERDLIFARGASRTMDPALNHLAEAACDERLIINRETRSIGPREVHRTVLLMRLQKYACAFVCALVLLSSSST